MKWYLNELESPSQIKPESYADGKSTSRSFSIAQHPRTPYFHHYLPTSAAETYPCDVDPPTLGEVCTAIRQLRNNRAPGVDGIPAEVYKTCLDSLGAWLHRVITKVWLYEAVPNNWSESVLLHLFKKGDKRICSNYRGISMIDITAKVLGVILLKRFQSERDQRTRPNQSGFRPGRGCTDQMHNLCHTQEQRWSIQQATVMCFVDFAPALDSVDRDSL